MNFNILGPFEVRNREGVEIRLPTGRERSLLVLLLINRGEVVSNDRIVDALWGEHPPGTAAKAVQGYVSHLRRLLTVDGEPGGPDGLLLTRLPGYVLRTADVAVDATRFERLAAEGRRALDDGSPAEAVAALDEGLALWRGPALSEFAFDDFAATEIRRLEELRLAAAEDRIDALLRLGRHGEAVGELDPLVAAYPLRERLRGLLMLALYRSGRQADALQAYRDARRLLSEELGLDPGPELQRLERAILAQDPELEVPATTPAREEKRSRPEPASAPRRTRRRLAIAGLLLAAVAAVAIAALALQQGGGPASVAVVAPALVAIDPDTNRVVAAIDVGSKPVTVTAGTRGVWIGDGRDGTVTLVDPVSRKVVKTVGIGAPAIDISASDGSVWVATGSFGTVVRIDEKLLAVTDRKDLADPADPVVPTASSVAAGEGRVWVGAFDGLRRIDPGSLEITAKVDLGLAPALQIAVGGGAVWATIISSRAKRVEASSARVTAELYAGDFVYAIALDSRAVWVGGETGQLWKIDPVTGATLLTSRVGTRLRGIALDAGDVWVALPAERTVVRLDPATGGVRATIPVGGVPEELVVSDGLVWVTVQSG